MTTDWDPWSYREKSGMTAQGGVNLVGHNVEATDGGIGKVDEATNEVGSSYIVVDTGPWIFGKKVLLPAGTVDRVDVDQGKVYVDLTKDQIKDSPEFDQSSYNEPDYRNRVGDYYGRYYTR
ncbi:MAG TPA: PRC-barrel domain-containing protein [Propionibacteriaceae bacterium]